MGVGWGKNGLVRMGLTWKSLVYHAGKFALNPVAAKREPAETFKQELHDSIR